MLLLGIGTLQKHISYFRPATTEDVPERRDEAVFLQSPPRKKPKKKSKDGTSRSYLAADNKPLHALRTRMLAYVRSAAIRVKVAGPVHRRTLIQPESKYISRR